MGLYCASRCFWRRLALVLPVGYGITATAGFMCLRIGLAWDRSRGAVAVLGLFDNSALPTVDMACSWAKAVEIRLAVWLLFTLLDSAVTARFLTQQVC